MALVITALEEIWTTKFWVSELGQKCHFVSFQFKHWHDRHFLTCHGHVGDMPEKCLTSRKNSYFHKHAISFLSVQCACLATKSLKKLMNKKWQMFFPWVILWYSPHTQVLWSCVLDTNRSCWKFNNRVETLWYVGEMSPTFLTKSLVFCHSFFRKQQKTWIFAANLLGNQLIT